MKSYAEAASGAQGVSNVIGEAPRTRSARRRLTPESPLVSTVKAKRPKRRPKDAEPIAAISVSDVGNTGAGPISNSPLSLGVGGQLSSETAGLSHPQNVTMRRENTRSNDQPPLVSVHGRRSPCREQCLIVMNLPEASEASAQARLDHDLALLRPLLIRIFEEGEGTLAASIKVTAAFRLGRPRDGGHPRPLKVVLGALDQARSVFQRVHRLRGDPVRILRDLSLEERQKLKAALCSLQERREKGEVDLVIRDFRVVKSRPKLRWQPLIPVAPVRISG